MGLSKNQKKIFDILNLLNDNNIKLFDSKEISNTQNPKDVFFVVAFNILPQDPTHKDTVHTPECTTGPGHISLAGNFTGKTFAIGLIKKNDMKAAEKLLSTIVKPLSKCSKCNPIW